MSEQTATARFFGDGEAFGDGGAWVYLGDTPEQLADAVKNWAETRSDSSSDGFRIEVRMMTDQQIDALPEL